MQTDLYNAISLNPDNGEFLRENESDEDDEATVEKRFIEACQAYGVDGDETEGDDLHNTIRDLIDQISKLKKPMGHDNLDAIEMQLPTIPDYCYPCRKRFPHEMERQEEFLKAMLLLYEGVEGVCRKGQAKTNEVYSNTNKLRDIFNVEQEHIQNHYIGEPETDFFDE